MGRWFSNSKNYKKVVNNIMSEIIEESKKWEKEIRGNSMIKKIDIELINQTAIKTNPEEAELKVCIKGDVWAVEKVHKNFLWALSKVCEEVKNE